MLATCHPGLCYLSPFMIESMQEGKGRVFSMRAGAKCSSLAATFRKMPFLPPSLPPATDRIRPSRLNFANVARSNAA